MGLPISKIINIFIKSCDSLFYLLIMAMDIFVLRFLAHVIQKLKQIHVTCKIRGVYTGFKGAIQFFIRKGNTSSIKLIIVLCFINIM